MSDPEIFMISEQTLRGSGRTTRAAQCMVEEASTRSGSASMTSPTRKPRPGDTHIFGRGEIKRLTQ